MTTGKKKNRNRCGSILPVLYPLLIIHLEDPEEHQEEGNSHDQFTQRPPKKATGRKQTVINIPHHRGCSRRTRLPHHSILLRRRVHTARVLSSHYQQMITGAGDGRRARGASPEDVTDEWKFSLYHLEQTEPLPGPRKKQLIPATLGPDRWSSLSAAPRRGRGRG